MKNTYREEEAELILLSPEGMDDEKDEEDESKEPKQIDSGS